MSILQEYEEVRKEIGNKKFHAISDYIDKFGKTEEFNKGVMKIKNIQGDLKWLDEYNKLREKYKPLFIDDVIYNKEEWDKFDKWYKETRKKERQNKEAR